MKVVILTGARRGMASLALPAILRAGHDVAAVVFVEGRAHGWKARFLRPVKKVFQIGLLGAINGIRMRPWFSQEPADLLEIEDIEPLAARHGVPFRVSPGTNSARTVEIMKETECSLGLSLGNSYISKKVFSIPSHGMINIHHELLPAYPGAQSVLWQIHDGSSVSGYTVHQVREEIDKGEILHRESVPISFEATLHQTVVSTCADLFQRSVDGLVLVLDHYSELIGKAEAQPSSGRRYTTPTWRQFRAMVRQHRRMYRSDVSFSR